MLNLEKVQVHLDIAFWQKLCKLKVDTWRLDDGCQPIHALLDNSTWLFDGESLDPETERQPIYRGSLYVLNSKEDFKGFQVDLNHSEGFILAVFADLKQFEVVYTLNFPFVAPNSPRLLTSQIEVPTFDYATTGEAFVVRVNAPNHLVIYDGTVRNPVSAVSPLLINEISRHFKENPDLTRLKVQYTNGRQYSECELELEAHKFGVNPNFIRADKGYVHHLKLRAFLDSEALATSAANFHIDLLKWRVLPEFNPESLRSLSCLIVGSGTLGCSVARHLAAYGVKSLTFLDNGYVSLTNPIRQNLFTHEDASLRKPKADAARDAMKMVHPGIQVSSVFLDIPLPGHPVEVESMNDRVKQLEELVDAHDVVFLLTDSRESRWLPALLIARKQRKGNFCLGVTVALGFDSYLISLQKQRGSGLSGCYFCQDDSAPSNSLAYRTLDQQCTVSRPGVSAIASAYAVELLAACSQDAQPFVGETLVEPSLLGLIPNHIRGFMDTYKNTLDCVSESPTCVCCSPPILEAYEEPGFLEQVCLNSEILKQVSGLSALQSDICYDDVIQLD